jgi:iron complex transport system substrate-binding protein
MRSLACTLAVIAGLAAAPAAGLAALDASRIVAVGGSVTEILYALGLGGQVVAVDATSVFPPEALRDKRNIGYLRQLSPEGVLSTNPSLVLAAAGIGPPETVKVLEASAVALVRVPDRFDGEGILAKIRLIASTAGTEARGECLAAAVNRDLAALAALRGKLSSPARIAFVLSFANGRAMVAGRNTAADGLIRLAGAVNVFGDIDGYKPVNDEAVVAARPEAVMAMSNGGPGALSAEQVFAHAGFSGTPAAARRAFLAVEARALGFGPFTATAAFELARTLYPALGAAPLPAASAEDCRR